MQKLKTKQKKKLQKFTKSINVYLKELQTKKLYEFMILHLPYIDDYNLRYISHTNKVEKAEDLGEILLSGIEDLVNIFAEDGLGIKDYEPVEDEMEQLKEFRELIESQFPPFETNKVMDKIQKKLKKLKQKDKTDSPYYKKLKKLEKEIEKIRDVLKIRHDVHSSLSALEWKLIKINLAISLTKLKNISAYAELQRLEGEAKEICKNIVTSTKQYDSEIENLQPIGK
ncbi:hypothetical protein MLC52_07135 [Sulfurimonas sp. NW15]|uniref:hypothetical protein n=1 Tax=Sulfurimonas sp. NW15 TaxID=2922729 RepID=UPI003DA9615A